MVLVWIRMTDVGGGGLRISGNWIWGVRKRRVRMVPAVSV